MEIKQKEIQVLAGLFLSLGFLFILFHNRQIHDEEFHLIEINNFFKNGLSISSLSQFATESGVFGHYLASLFLHIFPNSLLGSRIACLVMWVAIFVVFLKVLPSNQAYFFSFLFFLGQYFSFHLGAIFLTETPAIFLAFFAVYFLQKFLNSNALFYGLLTSLFLGLSLITRFYLMALYPTVLVYLVYLGYINKTRIPKIVFQVFTMACSIVFLAGLVYVWKGISPPVFKSRYPEFETGIGFGIARPIISLLYIGIFSFPIILLSNNFSFKASKNYALLALLLVYPLQSIVLNPWDTSGIKNHHTGLVDLVLDTINIHSHQAFTCINLLFQLISIASVLFIVSQVVKTITFNSKVLVFVLIFLIFYTIEQAFVDGNVAYYERYLLLVYPFLGILLYEAILKKTINRNLKIYLYLCICVSILKLLINFDLFS